MIEELSSEDELRSIYDYEALIMQVAHSDIVRYPPITLFAPDLATRMLRDYGDFIERKAKLSRAEAEHMVQTDLEQVVQAMRSTFVNYAHIGPVRGAVLLHVALFLGTEPLKAMHGLFACLKKRDYDGAYRELMLSSWPGLVGASTTERIRVLNLAEQMRTGEVTKP